MATFLIVVLVVLGLGLCGLGDDGPAVLEVGMSENAVEGAVSSRELTSHRVNGVNAALIVQALGNRLESGACYAYKISEGGDAEDFVDCHIVFQEGPLSEGVNGVTHEALLAVIEDRLIGFQSGPFSCRENAIALTHIQEAMMWLQKRTNDRMKRGVEGTNQP